MQSLKHTGRTFVPVFLAIHPFHIRWGKKREKAADCCREVPSGLEQRAHPAWTEFP